MTQVRMTKHFRCQLMSSIAMLVTTLQIEI